MGWGATFPCPPPGRALDDSAYLPRSTARRSRSSRRAWSWSGAQPRAAARAARRSPARSAKAAMMPSATARAIDCPGSGWMLAPRMRARATIPAPARDSSLGRYPGAAGRPRAWPPSMPGPGLAAQSDAPACGYDSSRRSLLFRVRPCPGVLIAPPGLLTLTRRDSVYGCHVAVQVGLSLIGGLADSGTAGGAIGPPSGAFERCHPDQPPGRLPEGCAPGVS